MKKLFLILAAAAMLAGCKTEEPTGIAVEYISHTIAGAGGTASFTVHPGAVQDWSISFPPGFDADWFDLSAASGNGKTTVTATLEPNPDFWEREITVIVTAGERSLPIIITQEAAELIFNVTPESYTDLPGNEGGQFMTRTLTVTANIGWYAEIETDETAGRWIFFLPDGTPTYGSRSQPQNGDAEISLRIDNYYAVAADNPRSGKVRFYNISGELLKEVTISQQTSQL